MFGKKKKHENDDAWEIVDDDYTDTSDAQPVQTPSPPQSSPQQYFTPGQQPYGGQQQPLQPSQPSSFPSSFSQAQQEPYYQDVSHVVDGDTESTGMINAMEEKEKLLGEKKKKNGFLSRFRKKQDDEADDADEEASEPVYDTSDMLGRDYLHEPGAELEHEEDEDDEEYGMHRISVRKLATIGITAFAAIIIGLGIFNTDFRNGHAYIVPLDVHYEREYVNRSDDVYDYLMKLADELPEQAQALPNDYISMSNKIQDEKDTLKSKTDRLSRYTNVPKTLNAYHSKLLNLSILTQEYLQNLLDNYTHSDYMSFAESGYSDFTNALADIHTLRVQINTLIHRNIDGSADTSGLTTGSGTGSTANDDSTASGARTETDASGGSSTGAKSSSNQSGNSGTSTSGTTGSSAVTEIPNINDYSREDADNANGAQAASNVQKTGEQITSPYSSYNSSASSSGGSSGNGSSKKSSNSNNANNSNNNSNNNNRTPSFGEQAQAASNAAASSTQSAIDMTNTNNTAVNDAMGGNMAAGMGM